MRISRLLVTLFEIIQGQGRRWGFKRSIFQMNHGKRKLAVLFLSGLYLSYLVSRIEGQRAEERMDGVQRCRVIDKKYTPERSNVLSRREILLSDSIDPKRRLQRTDKDIGAENDLLNDLGFNLCVVPWSLVVRLVAYFGVMEVIKTEILSGQVEELERIR